MAVIEKFLGKTVEIPEDRHYAVKQNLWGRQADQAIWFGLTQPGLVLLGGIKTIDWLLEDGQPAQPGDSVAFTITGKILYIDTPVGGNIFYNQRLRENPACVNEDPYGTGWLFRVELKSGTDQAYHQSLVPFQQYLDSLHASEGFKNPEGLKGGVSGVCKAVYYSIGQQKI
jgi:glycine cleavage system H protein